MTTNFDYQADEYIKHKQDLNVAFGKFIDSDNEDVRISTISAISHLIEVIEPKDAKSFENLIP